MKLLRALGILVVAGASALTASALCVTSAQALTLDDVLRNAQQERNAVRAENARREKDFLSNRNQQSAKLAAVQRKLRMAEVEQEKLEAAYTGNAEKIEALSGELDDKQGEFSELFGQARSAADDLALQFENSIISSQFPGRSEALREMAQSDVLPKIEQLEALYIAMLREMVEQPKIVKYDALVYDKNGEPKDAVVTRIGPYMAFTKGGKYAVMNKSAGALRILERQPAGPVVDAARLVERSDSGTLVSGVIDPALGQLLSLVVEQPSLSETVEQGKLVGKVIIGIALIGIAIGLYKWLTLSLTGMAVRGQIRKKTANKGNPLGRVMMAYESNTAVDTDTLQLKLDDAILKELPKLDGGLNLVKVLAAVAPLLGLLGTVIGMINTFRAITLFGTGDPQLMAGGISEALVTTVLGLVAAIPLLLIHGFASGASRNVAQVIEEQAAGMVAEHAESRS